MEVKKYSVAYHCRLAKIKAALVGSNGAGKSTLLKILAGFDKVDTGSIQLNGDRIGYLPQEIKIDSQRQLETILSE